MHRPYSLVLLLTLFLLGCQEESNPPTPNPTSGFPTVAGRLIVDASGNPLRLKGVAFGNEIWGNQLSTVHHNETDFQRVKSMNMNVVRFYLNYQFFENDANPGVFKQSGWDWLDQNIAWAKKYGVMLILNMHAPQGGYQSQGNGDALWTNTTNQTRLTALWKAIAKRYADEQTILGYGLVNEPFPTQSIQQWSQLAQQLTDAIRAVDTNHLIFIERALNVKIPSGQDPTNFNFPQVTGKNLVYEFHFYDPFSYTHQLFDWANTGDGGKYPDDNILSFSNATWYTATFGNPKLSPGNSEWRLYEGVKYKITDPKIKIALPALVGQNSVGKVQFDNLILKEYAPDGSFSRTILEQNLNSSQNWYFWSANGVGTGGLNTSSGYDDASSLMISGATGDANMSNYDLAFRPKQGYSYQISGYMKGENIAANATAMLRIDFQTTETPVVGRGKESLKLALEPYISWGKTKNVPLYLGEFGAGIHCFENGKGGVQWVEDMLDICREQDLGWTYHAYHEYSFGIYRDGSKLPDESTANIPLIELFKRK